MRQMLKERLCTRPGWSAGQKNGDARSAAKFREETSKKQSGKAAVLHRSVGSPALNCKD
jgi:hypothetical protein